MVLDAGLESWDVTATIIKVRHLVTRSFHVSSKLYQKLQYTSYGLRDTRSMQQAICDLDLCQRMQYLQTAYPHGNSFVLDVATQS